MNVYTRDLLYPNMRSKFATRKLDSWNLNHMRCDITQYFPAICDSQSQYAMPCTERLSN